MEELIDKELLCEVLSDDSIDFIDRELRNGESVGYFSNRDREKKYIDMYRIEQKYKAWAKTKDYNIIEISEDKYWVIHMKHNIALSFNYGMIEHTGDSIFSCCQWIKENKNENNI